MTRAKRILSLILCVSMLLTMLPSAFADDVKRLVSDDEVRIITLAEGGEGEPEGGEPGEETEPAEGSPMYVFNNTQQIEVYLHPFADNEIDEELIGDRFQYKGYVLFKGQTNYTGFQDQYAWTGPLYEKYEDVNLYIKAPDGIKFVDGDGNDLLLESEGDYAGYYKIAIGSVDAPDGGDHRETIENRIYAVMTGNGQTKAHVYDAVKAVITAKANVLQGYEGENRVYEYVNFPASTINNDTDYSVKGLADGSWTYNKYNEEQTAVKEEGDWLYITTFIEAGRDSNGNVSNQDNDYARFGMIDIDTLTITDEISLVTGVDGDDKVPAEVKIYKGTTEVTEGASYDEGSQIVTITEKALDTIDASGYGAGTVKRGTVFKIVAKYAKNNFVYPVGTSDADAKDFVFKDEASLEYTLKDGSAVKPEGTKDAETGWHAVAKGGNAGVQAKIFLNENATSCTDYSLFYSNTCGFGTISYKLYQTDPDGRILDGDDAWSMTIDLAEENNTSGYTGTDLYKALDKLVPVGRIAIVPDISNLNSELIVLVNKNNNSVITDPRDATMYVDVTVDGIVKTSFYLRYINGGMVHIKKAFVDKSGNTAAPGGTTSFMFTNNTTGKEYSVNIGTDGTAVIALPAGTYTVEETAPEGYIPYKNTSFTVKPNDNIWLPNSSTKSEDLTNYPSEAIIDVNAYITDFYSKGTMPTGSKTTVSGVTFQVQQKSAGSETWENYGNPVNVAGNVTVPRFDSSANAYEYRIVAVTPENGGAYAGLMNGTDTTTMKDNNPSEDGSFYSDSFNFATNPGNGVTLIQEVRLYYLNKITITVKKTVNDPRDAAIKRNTANWTMKLTSSDGTEYTADTDSTGKAVFTGLPKTGADGKTLTYTVTEVLSDAEKELWTVTQSATEVKADKASAEVTVTNTLNMGTVNVYKCDNDTSGKVTIADTVYTFYAVADDGSKLWVTDQIDSVTGFRVLTDDATKASEFTTDKNGLISLTKMPSGYRYAAHEVKANKNYYLNTVDNAIVHAGSFNRNRETDLSKGTVLKPNGTVTTYLCDVKLPSLTVEKRVVDSNGTTVSYKNASISGISVSFELYRKATEAEIADESVTKISVTGKDGTVQIVRAKDADGNVQKKLTATNNGNFFQTEKWQLTSGGEYYLLESDVNARLVTPANAATVPSSQKYVVGSDGKIYYGPWTIDDNTTKAQEVHFLAYNYINNAQLNVEKYNSYNDQKLTVKDSGMKYVIVAQLKDGDQTTIDRFTKNGGTFTTTCPVEDFDVTAKAGYTLYYSAWKDQDTCTITAKDSAGDNIEYWVIEITPPTGYKNKVAADGTATAHEWAKATLENGTYTAKIKNAPDTKLSIVKSLTYIWDLVSNLPSYYQSGVPMALYSADKTTGTLTFIKTVKTTGMGKAEFADLALDLTKYNYYIVETDSLGYDTKYIPGDSTDYRVAAFDPAAYTGKTVEQLKADKPDTNMVEFKGADSVTYDATEGAYTGTKSASNYDPYIQIRVNKYNDKNKNGVKDEDEKPLNMCKFNLFTVTKEQWAANPDAEALIANKTAKTDGYVYETDDNGQFITIADKYYDETVYIFKEIEAKDGFKMPDYPYIVATPDDYKSSKNGIYDCDDFPNTPLEGGEPSFIRYFNIELDKFSDRDANLVYSAADLALADTYFETKLVTLDKGTAIDSENFETRFVTGTDSSDPSYGYSETLEITMGTLNTLAGNGTIMDVVFRFFKQDGTQIEWEDFKALAKADLLNAQIEFVLRLEETDYPALTTPMQLYYYVTIRTTAGVKTDKTYTISKHNSTGTDNPIMNVYGNKVFAQVRKYVGDNRWVPVDDKDYVEITIRSTSPVKGEIDEHVVRIDSTNYNLDKITLLEPETEYVAYESHAPKGMDKPRNNYYKFTTGKLTTIMDKDPDIRIQKVDLKDTPYVTLTFRKVDLDGNGLEYKTLKLVYKNGNAIKDANFEEIDEDLIKQDTNGDGYVSFNVPLYDYSANKDGVANQPYAVAEYKVIELVNGSQYEGFDVMNSKFNQVVKADRTGNILLVNPAVGSLVVTKYGAAVEIETLEGVNFKLEYTPITADALTSTSVPAVPSGVEWQTVRESDQTEMDGKLTYTGLNSGWYRLTETKIPEGYANEGKSFVITFVLVTTPDRYSMMKLDSKTAFFWKDDKTEKKVFILSTSVDGVTSQSFNTAEDTSSNVSGFGVSGISVFNTALAHLKVNKTVVKTGDAWNGNVAIDIFKASDLKKPVATATIAVADNAGSTEDIALEPGEYVIRETIAENGEAWTGSWSSKTASGSTDPALWEKHDFADGAHTGSTKTITLTALDTVRAESTVDFINYSAAINISALKKDNYGNLLENCEFVLYIKKDGTELFYQGVSEDKTHGVWGPEISKAIIAVSDENGVISFENVCVPADAETLAAVTTGTMYVREVKADTETRALMEKDYEFTYKLGEDVNITEAFVDYSGLAIDVTLIGHTKANAEKHGDSATKVKGAVFELYKVDKDGNASIVLTVNESGSRVSSKATDKDGMVSFDFLDRLKTGESYVLVEKTVTAGYWDTDTYYDTTMGVNTTGITINGKTYKATTVITYENQDTPSNKKELTAYKVESTDTTVPFEFTNERHVGAIEVSKELAGTGTDFLKDTKFEFTTVIRVPADYSVADDHGNLPKVTVTDAEGNEVEGRTAEISTVVDAEADVNDIIVVAEIKGTETLIIDNVLVGSTYTITEENYVKLGVIKTTADSIEYDTLEASENEVKLSTDGEMKSVDGKTHKYINERNSAPLTVTKTLAGNATDPEKEFTFTVTLSREDIIPIDGEYVTVLKTPVAAEETDAEPVEAEEGEETEETEEAEETEPKYEETAGTLTFTKVEDAEGNVVEATFTLKGGESLVITDILYDTEYLVVEDDYSLDGYITEGNNAAAVIKSEKGDEVEVINNRNLSEIDVSKKLTGNATDPTMRFSFTMVLTRTDTLPVAGTYETLLGETEGTLEFVADEDEETNSATATFTLRGGQTLKILGIYADTSYEVTEKSYKTEGYTTTSAKAKGVSSVDEVPVAVFTNNRVAGDLKVSKTVKAIGMGIPVNEIFEFTLQLTRNDEVAYNDTLTTVDQDGAKGELTVTDGVATFTLKHDQSLTIEGILSGTTYTVTETPLAVYITDAEGNEGTIETEQLAEALFTNTITNDTVTQRYRDLTIRKRWDDNDNLAEVRVKSVTVTVSTQEGTVGVYELSAANDWQVTIENLPRIGANGEVLNYSVIESKVTNYTTSYVVNAKAGYITVKNTIEPFIIEEPPIPLGADLNMNEGYCFN